MGRDKALLPWPKVEDGGQNPALPQSTLLSCSIQALSRYCELIFVVSGANAENLRPLVHGCGADLVVNRNVHKVYRVALPLMIVLQGITIYLWRGSPAWWLEFCQKLLA